MTDRPVPPDSEQQTRPTDPDALLTWLGTLARRHQTPSAPPTATENVPPRPAGLFAGLFSERRTAPSSGSAQTVQDQEAAAEMVLNLAHTLQTYPRHTPAILQYAINGLGRVGNATEHLPLIVPFLDRNWEQSVRLAAVRAIGALGGEAAIDVLIGLLNDSDIVIRWEVQAALDRLLTASAEAPSAQPPSAELEEAAEESGSDTIF